jgi:hypothetical protein
VTDPEFTQLVYDMRQAQIAFFTSQSDRERKRLLGQSRALEKKVDEALMARMSDGDEEEASGATTSQSPLNAASNEELAS